LPHEKQFFFLTGLHTPARQPPNQRCIRHRFAWNCPEHRHRRVIFRHGKADPEDIETRLLVLLVVVLALALPFSWRPNHLKKASLILLRDW